MIPFLLCALLEQEPNGRTGSANPLCIDLPVQGVIANRHDLDCFEVFIREPALLDIRVITGPSIVPLSGVGGSGGTQRHAGGFIPVLRFFGPDGRLLHVEVSEAQNLLMLDVPVPLHGQSFYIELSALFGASGEYGLLVSPSF